ncbi:hypothetical protein D3C71_1476960 [compost metagenome]
MNLRGIAPLRQDLLLGQRNGNKQRVVGQMLEHHQALDAIDGRDQSDHSGAGTVGRGGQGVVGNHPAQILHGIRTPQHDRALCKIQRDGPPLANIEAVEQLQDVAYAHGGQQDPGEVSIGVVNAFRHRHYPLTRRTALNGLADQHPAASVLAVKDEIIPVGIVGLARLHGLGMHQPFTASAVDKQAMEIIRTTEVRHHDRL